MKDKTKTYTDHKKCNLPEHKAHIAEHPLQVFTSNQSKCCQPCLWCVFLDIS